MDRRGMQRRGSPARKWRGAFFMLVACVLAPQGVGFGGIVVGEGVETQDVVGGGQTPEGPLTAGDGEGYDGAVASGTGRAANANDDASEKEEDANKGFVAPAPSEAVQVNEVQDIEQEELKKKVNELPPELLEELPEELWGVRDLENYKRAEKNIRKGNTAITVGAGIAGVGGLALLQVGRVGNLTLILSFLAALGLTATPAVVVGAIRRRIGRQQKKRLEDRLRGKKKAMELRAQRLPMLLRGDPGVQKRDE